MKYRQHCATIWMTLVLLLPSCSQDEDAALPQGADRGTQTLTITTRADSGQDGETVSTTEINSFRLYLYDYATGTEKEEHFLKWDETANAWLEDGEQPVTALLPAIYTTASALYDPDWEYKEGDLRPSRKENVKYYGTSEYLEIIGLKPTNDSVLSIDFSNFTRIYSRLRIAGEASSTVNVSITKFRPASWKAENMTTQSHWYCKPKPQVTTNNQTKTAYIMRIKTNLTTIALAATVVLAAGCGNDGDTPSEAAKYITVNTSIGQMTRVATDADGSQRFEANDQISVYAWTGTAAEVNTAGLVVNNSVNTYNGTTWTASPQMLWQDPDTPHFFLGIYPAKAQIASVVTDFAADNYTLNVDDQEASDLLVAVQTGDKEAGLTATDNPVRLTFDHVMAKFIVNLTFRSQWGGTPTVGSVKATGLAASATVDYLAKTATAASADKQDISLPAVTANTCYASVMVPQSGFRQVTVSIGGSPFTYIHSGDIRLEKGRITTLNLIVGRDRIELGDVSVNDWQQGDVINGGEAN